MQDNKRKKWNSLFDQVQVVKDMHEEQFEEKEELARENQKLKKKVKEVVAKGSEDSFGVSCRKA